MGRDQNGNAERVSALGAGMTIEVSSPPEIVRSAVVDVMSSSKYSKAARRLADVIATYGNGARAVAELEGLLYPHK
jgi:UDP:flavonoid glycosyltransferase YjiC (YdhE family)